MSFFDYFRNFLGVKRRNEPGTSGLDEHNSPKDGFRNPIWQSDDDDEVDIDEFIFNGNNMKHFNIFSDPLEMAWYFESQIDNMLKNFGFGHNSFFRMLPGEKEGIEALPFAESDEAEKHIGLRDKLLKSKPEIFDDQNHDQRVDTDVDGKITTEEFSKLWNKGHLETVKPSTSHSFSFGKSVRKEIVRKSDGTVEKKQVIRDSEGNEETIVSKEIGDKRYVVTTKKDKNGIETKSEDLFNINENELKEFTQKWTSKNDTDTSQPILNRFPWEKFFGPNPKL